MEKDMESSQLFLFYEFKLLEKCKDLFFKIHFNQDTSKRAFDERGNKISIYAWLNKIKRSDFFVTEDVNAIMDEMTLSEIKKFFVSQLEDFYEQSENR